MVYWDEGRRSSGNLTKLVQIDAYDQSHFNISSGLITGHTYTFQVSSINGVGEGPKSQEVEARAASLPGQLGRPERTNAVYDSGASTAAITLRWYQ